MPKYRKRNWEGGVQETVLLDSGRSLAQSSFTCGHCNRVVVVPFRARPDECGSLCFLCWKPACSRQACQACVPFEKKLEEQEARAKLLASLR